MTFKNLKKQMCEKCHTEMLPSKAIAQTYKPGVEDLGGATLQPSGPGELIDVMKCPKCGHSVMPEQ